MENLIAFLNEVSVLAGHGVDGSLQNKDILSLMGACVAIPLFYIGVKYLKHKRKSN